MSLTPHLVLRDLILGQLLAQGGSGSRADVLAAIDEVHGAFWTADDLSSPPSRPFETKWRSRCSWERVRMIEDGLLEQQDDGIWALTTQGLAEAEKVNESTPAAWRSDEIERRDSLWSKLGGTTGPLETTALLINEIGIFRGGRGIYFDKEATESPWAPSGAAVSFLDLGVVYANELDEHGVVYHYPTTTKPGRDESEIAATRAAYEAGLPVFVITKGKQGSKSRTVFRGYIESLNDAGRVALITFANDGKLPPPPPSSETGKDFALTSEDEEFVWAKRRARPNQARFAFLVTARYGAACAFCSLSVPDALEAAHIRAKSKKGSDDARNGLVMCRNHHRMFDRFLFAIDPNTFNVITRGNVALDDLQITSPDLSHLPFLPHEDALADAWQSWTKAISK